MTQKLDFIPRIENYARIVKLMREDLDYRLADRRRRTRLGRPLYRHINVQVITSHACPYKCPFCLERQHPMEGRRGFDAQLSALESVLSEHPDARLSITGGEPGLYPEHVSDLIDVFDAYSNNVFCSINTAGYIKPGTKPLGNDGRAHINLSWNDFVQPDATHFPGCTMQTVLPDDRMNLPNIKRFITEHPGVKNFSFRFLSGMSAHEYPVGVWNELRDDPECDVRTFRVGDFFAYATFDYAGTHNRVTLGDMHVQTHNDYGDGYSNIIIHPDGRVGVNWK